MKTQPFEGFPKDMIDFLWELRFNNYKEWFHEHKDRYQASLREPLNSFGVAVCEELKDRLKMDFVPSVSRINRDVRFSKNKEPYRDHMWIVFKQDTGTWKDKPCIFFEIGVDFYMIGMGLYESSPNHMKVYRDMIDANVPAFERLIKPYKKRPEFAPAGDLYKKISDGAEKSADALNWYKRKELAIIKRCEMSDVVFGNEIVGQCCDDYEFLLPMLRFYEKIRV